MARNPDTPCSSCGKLLWGGSRSLPGGTRQCQACRESDAPRHVLFSDAPVRHLAVVRGDGTVPAPPSPRSADRQASVLTAAESGSELDQLLAMSARLARSIADPGTNATQVLPGLNGTGCPAPSRNWKIWSGAGRLQVPVSTLPSRYNSNVPEPTVCEM